MKSFPGILLLGDWHGKEINLEFFDEVKKELNSQHYNAFTLKDVEEELKRKGGSAGDVQIRTRGVDAAAVVLLVDGVGTGTAAETTHICEKDHWNKKCIPFVVGQDIDSPKIMEEKDYLSNLANSAIYYKTKEELKMKLIAQGKSAAKKWIKQKLSLESKGDKNK